jgi:Xaa-Pro dipeptidase
LKIPNPIFKQRLKDTSERMRKLNLQALVIYSTGSMIGNSSRTHGYIRYLCGWDGRNLPSVLIVVPEKDPILLVTMRSAQLYAKETLWFDDIRVIPQAKLGHELIAIIDALSLKNQKIGYIGRGETPAPIYDVLQNGAGGAELIEAHEVIDEQRIIKDKIQIVFHQRAAEICDAMFETLTREIGKGKKAYQLQADLEYTAKYEGCEHASTFLSVGPVVDRPRYARGECSRVPQKGDQVLIALFVMYEGHWGHAIRTGTIGEPNKAQLKAFNIVLEMQEAALNFMKPGLDLNEVWIASDNVLRTYYPNVRDLDWYWLKTGHSLGLDYNDPVLSDVFPNPYLLKNEDIEKQGQGKSSIKIQEGMLFELHPNIFIPDEAAGVIGDMVLVTEEGHEILNRFPRQLIIW